MAKHDDKMARAFVREYMERMCGVSLVDLDRRHDQKTADFEMVDAGERILVAELKTLEDIPPSAETGWTIRTHEDGSTESFREDDNGPARVLRAVGEAHKQLSVYPHPWAIIILNNDPMMGVGDFFEGFRGERVLGVIDGHRVINVASRKVALGHTLPIRYEVDLYIWIERKKQPRIGVWWATLAGEAIARRYFSAAERRHFYA